MSALRRQISNMISSEKIPQEHWEPWPWGWSPLGRWRAALRGQRATPDKEEPAMKKLSRNRFL